MENDTLEISHAVAVRSYAFWSAWWEPKPDDGPKFKKVKSAVGFFTAKPADLLNLNQGICPFCQGTSVIKFSDIRKTGPYEGNYVICVCRILSMKERDWEDLESPWTSSMVATLKATGDKKTQEYTNFIKHETRDFIKGLGKWIYLYGGYGSGKTHLLNAVKTVLRGLALYVNSADLAAQLRSSAGKFETSDLIDTIAAAPVLLVDDFGTEKGSDFLYSALYTIINRRYVHRELAPVYITSNLSQDEIQEHPDENARRIATRLNDRRLVSGLITTQADYRSMK